MQTSEFFLIRGKTDAQQGTREQGDRKRETRVTVQDDQSNSYFGSYKGSLSLVEVYHL